MNITKIEAQTMVCPFIQQLNAGTGHQMYGTCSNITCITSECMAWLDTTPKKYTDTNKVSYSSEFEDKIKDYESKGYTQVDIDVYGGVTMGIQLEVHEEDKIGKCLRLYPEEY